MSKRYQHPRTYWFGEMPAVHQDLGEQRYPRPQLSEAEQVIANARADAFDRQTRRINQLQTRVGWGVILTVFVIVVSRCAG